MKKRFIFSIVIMLLAVSTAFGQIVLTAEDQGLNPRVGSSSPELGVMVPMQNTNLDQYTEGLVPLGEGWLLLACLGGGYLLRKKVRSEK